MSVISANRYLIDGDIGVGRGQLGLGFSGSVRINGFPRICKGHYIDRVSSAELNTARKFTS